MADNLKKIHYKLTHPSENRWILALVASVGSGLCIGTLAFIDQMGQADYLLIAPFGATMVLVFGLPNSVLAQPKNVIFGHILTAFVGLIFVNFVPVSFWSLGLAVALGIFFMITFKVTHPPAGGNPLLIMIGGHTSWLFLAYPVAAGAVLIIIIALLYHRFVSRLEYSFVNKVD